MADTSTVALLGTGTMGAGMARNIVRAGIDTSLIDALRGQQRRVVDAGQADEDLAATYRVYDQG